MSEAKGDDKHKIVVIAIDGSEQALHAFNCEYENEVVTSHSTLLKHHVQNLGHQTPQMHTTAPAFDLLRVRHGLRQSVHLYRN